MKVRIVILIVVVLLLLTGAVGQSSAPALAQGSGPVTILGGGPAGGNYRLSAVAGEALFLTSGGGYRLLRGSNGAPAALPDQGSGCCCAYLPCMFRQFP